MAGMRIPNSVPYVTRSATTPGVGSKVPCACGASAGAGSGTNSVAAMRRRSSSGDCAARVAAHPTTSRKSLVRTHPHLGDGQLLALLFRQRLHPVNARQLDVLVAADLAGERR